MTARDAPRVVVLGIRHHGPGSARSVLSALAQLRPRRILIEAPADATGLLRWIGHPDLVPPVALLGHEVGRPQRAQFSPFTAFSPEWQAVVWANQHGVEVTAIDLPHSAVLATPDDYRTGADPDRRDGGPVVDPLGVLAAAAGESDAERWWDDLVEHRGDGLAVFDAVTEAMAAVREGVTPTMREARREAHMRRAIRAAIRELCEAGEAGEAGADADPGPIAVVCGAWHAPVLDPAVTTVAADAALLRGMARSKVVVTWVPWTHRRLASGSYGAGVRSPGWYHHVFRHEGSDTVARFVVEAARLIRDAGLSASPDHLVAVTRLAETLAALRGRPRAGLDEVLDAFDSVTGGVAVVTDRLVIGHAVGAVPDDAPQVPLARDLAALQRRLRLRVSDEATVVELDLRTATGRSRSHLLHRLGALGVPWGLLEEGRGSSGTFRETWRLRWEPEFSVRLAESAGYGTTVERSATARLIERTRVVGGLGELASALDTALVADLPDAVAPIVDRLSQRAAADPDVAALVDALGPLARSLRYGDVRATDLAALRQAFDGLVVRVLAGLVPACRSLDDGAAAAMVERLSAMQAALALVDHPDRSGGFVEVLRQLADPPLHGLVQGRAARLLHDAGANHPAELEHRLGRALSGGTPPGTGARFVEGFLAGSGTMLLHDSTLREVVDHWLGSLPAESFTELIPLLRRTFGGFEVAERRQLGELLTGGQLAVMVSYGTELDDHRMRRTLGTVRSLLGLPEHSGVR